MKTIKASSLKAQRFIDAYFNSEYSELGEVYGKYSRDKYIAQMYCKDRCRQEEGYKYRIISANTFQFTVAWTIPGGNIRIETRNNSYQIVF